MIINNKSIKGIVEYSLGINFEVDDVLISKGKLYHVHTEFLSSNELNDISVYCNDYLQYVAYDPVTNPNPNAPLTPTAFLNMFNRFYGGVSFDGIKSVSDITKDEDLISENFYLPTVSVYRINVISNDSEFLMKGEYIVKTFKTEHELLQEITPIYKSFDNYTGSGMYLVQYDLSEGVPLMYTRIIAAVTPPKSNYINQLIGKLVNYRTQVTELLNTGRYFYQIPIANTKSSILDLSQYGNSNYFIVVISGTDLKSYSIPVSMNFLHQQLVETPVGSLNVTTTNVNESGEVASNCYSINLLTSPDLVDVDYFITSVIVGKTLV